MNNLEIKKHNNEKIGSLTSFYNPKTGNLMFPAKDVGKMLGHSNIRKAIKDAKLDKSDVLVVDLQKYKEFKNSLRNWQLLSQRTSKMTFVTEKGLYALLLNSHLPEHRKFKDWVTGEVLPSIRKTGKYDIRQSFTLGNLEQNMLPPVQKQHSKEVNAINMDNGGTDAIIQYNRLNCKLHTGRLPHEIKELGKRAGLPSSKRTSAKEVFRHTYPEIAASMSLLDNAVTKGFKIDDETEEILKLSSSLFKKLLNKGLCPGELSE